MRKREGNRILKVHWNLIMTHSILSEISRQDKLIDTKEGCYANLEWVIHAAQRWWVAHLSNVCITCTEKLPSSCLSQTWITKFSSSFFLVFSPFSFLLSHTIPTPAYISMCFFSFQDYATHKFFVQAPYFLMLNKYHIYTSMVISRHCNHQLLYQA